jgi:hypothetical protein
MPPMIILLKLLDVLIYFLNAFTAHTGKQWIGGHRQQASIFH